MVMVAEGLPAGIVIEAGSVARSLPVAAVPSVIDSKGNVDGLPNALLEAMAAGRLAAAGAGIELGFAALAQRAPAKRMWASVHDQSRFVLQPYAQQASASEAKAATAILKQLSALAS